MRDFTLYLHSVQREYFVVNHSSILEEQDRSIYSQEMGIRIRRNVAVLLLHDRWLMLKLTFCSSSSVHVAGAKEKDRLQRNDNNTDVSYKKAVTIIRNMIS